MVSLHTKKDGFTLKLKLSRNALRIYKLEISLIIGLILAVAVGYAAEQTSNELTESVVRLHVLAASDSEEDQALKLKVRDTVLNEVTEMLDGVSDRDIAKEILQAKLKGIEAVAAQRIAAEGYDYDVTAELEVTDFPVKEYTGFALPNGSYLALRVLISEGKGKNWWCVVFPPLCTSAAIEDTAYAAGLSDESVSLITRKNQQYEIKFKSVEIWNGIKTWFNQ